jgi:hypothetical protein
VLVSIAETLIYILGQGSKGKNTKKTAENKIFSTFLLDKDFFRKINYNNSFIKLQKDFEKYSVVVSELTREVGHSIFIILDLNIFIFCFKL